MSTDQAQQRETLSPSFEKLRGLALCSVLVGFTLHSWSAAFGLFIGLVVSLAVPQIRVFGMVALVAGMGVVTWGLGGAMFRAFEKSHSLIHTGYLIGIAGLFGSLILSLFASVLWSLMFRRPESAPNSCGYTSPTRSEYLLLDVERMHNDPFDPYRVLGVRRGADRKEIRSAYRQQMKLYHPDRLSHFGDELKNAAHQRVLLIQRALTELTAR